MGNRQAFLQQALQLLTQQLNRPVAVSSLYETAAWGNTNQPDFLNQVLVFEHAPEAETLLETILAIEQKMGRVRQQKWAGRNIDIDILFYGSQVINTPHLQIPHPYLHQRRFTLEPLAEVAPGFVHPVFKKNIQQLLAVCPDKLEVTRL
ncbi:MAG: 2-amino-4-hydroxy-6-hydroxymethyldihydropteridine diphosphokinase [Bacteroidia bacterium]|nr:2-amino-4-hydroxy-6-hydroxymethyldihydropteridine diphosphokinase [Bacteroidia bacterium]